MIEGLAMFDFAKTPKATRLAMSATSAMPRRTPCAPHHELNSILLLQRAIGNQAVQRLREANVKDVKGNSTTGNSRFDQVGSRVQPQLRIGALDDPLEREADGRADAVMADHPARQSDVSRRASSRKAAGGMAPQPIAAAHAQLALVDGGRPLSAGERSYFEPRFSTDLSRVRLHTGPSANVAARGLCARAFTLGADIGFASPAIPPRTLAHELAHVVQPDRSGPVLRREPDDGGPGQIQKPAQYVGDWRCGGGKCITDEEIYAGLARSHAEDVAAEHKATAERKRRLDIKRHGTKQQKWEIEFEEDPRLTRNIGAVAGTRDEGTMTPSGVRVPSHVGDYLSPRVFYEHRDAAMLAWQGFIHYAEIVEAGQAQAALNLALARNSGYPIPDNRLDLRAYTHWAERAHDAREKAMLLAMVAEAGAAGEAASASLAMQRAESSIATQLGELIGKPATLRGAQITVEGVGMSGVRVTVQNGELVASYDTIVNVSRVSGQGRRIHSAFEAATVQAARAAGLTSARVAVESIVNPVWKAYLESVGYVPDMMVLREGVFSWVLTKALPL
jgi:hypothetical protein